MTFEGDLLVFEEGVGFVLEEDFVTFGLGVVLGEEESVDGVLGPVLGEVRDGFVVAFKVILPPFWSVTFVDDNETVGFSTATLHVALYVFPPYVMDPKASRR